MTDKDKGSKSAKTTPRPTSKAKASGARRPLERKVPLNDAHLMESKRQCPAISKRTGERCKRYCAMGMRTCRWHGSATRVAHTAAAKRIAQASGYAADMLVEFMADPDIDVQTRTKIAQDLLNRAGVSEKTILELQKPMSAFEEALFRTARNPDGTPAYAQNEDGQWKATSPHRGAITGEIVSDLDEDEDEDDDTIDAEVVDEPEDDYEYVEPEPRTRHDRIAFHEADLSARAREIRDATAGNRSRKEVEAEEMRNLRAAARQNADDDPESGMSREQLLLSRERGDRFSSRGRSRR